MSPPAAVTPDIDVVVLSYDGRALLDTVLASAVAQRVPGRRVRVIMVDNGSHDDSVAHVERSWPAVRVIRIGENRGVTPGLNRGILDSRAPLVALLNNDVELEAGWLAALVTALDADPEAGSAVGKLLDFFRRDVIDGCGDEMPWSGAANRRGHGQVDHGQYDRPGEVLSACGGAALYRRAALDDVGLFDAGYRAYYEDADWGLRAQLRGWRCRYAPDAVAYHMGSATTRPAENTVYARLARRNMLVLVAKTYPADCLLRFWPRVLGYQLRWLLDSTRAGLAGVHLAAWRDFARSWPAVRRARREVQAGRRVGRRRLDEVMGTGGPAPDGELAASTRPPAP